MADILKCDSCEELRNKAPNFTINGIGDTEVQNLIDNKGLAGNSDNCTDVNDMNDCLVGMMDREVDAYETCDWKVFMKRFIPNLWSVLKAIISWLCGINCRLDYLQNGATFSIGENTKGDAYAVAGKGVTFLEPKAGEQHTSDLSLRYIAGGLISGGGSYRFYDSDFTDQTTVGNFDNGSTYRESESRKGNAEWGKADNSFANGGELICEFRIKKSAYPQIKRLFNGFGQETGGGAYHVQALVFDGDSIPDGQSHRYAYGQHGWCDDDGTPSSSGYDSGHIVEKGWIYIQLRMSHCFHMNASGTKYSPRYFMGVRMNADEIPCG